MSEPLSTLEAADGPSSRFSKPPARTPAIGPTLLVHATLLVAVCGAALFVIPHYVAIYRELQLALPAATQFIIGLERALHGPQALGLLLLAAVDFGLCLLARAVAGRRGLRCWTAAVVLGCFVLGGFAGFALQNPLNHALTRVSVE